jgi:outer membrane protein TolC
MQAKTFFLMMAALGFCLRAEEPGSTYAVDELVARLLQVNPALRIQDRSGAIDYENLRLEGRLPNPRLSATMGSGKPHGAAEAERRIWGMGVEWTLPNPATRAHTLRGRRWEIRAAEAWRQKERWQQVHAFKARLYDLLRLESQREMQEEMVADLERIATIVDARVAVGEAKRLDSLWTKSALALARTRHREMAGLIAARRQEIHAALAGTLPPEIAVADEAGPLPAVPALPELVARLRDNPGWQARRSLVSMCAAQVTAAKSGWFPDLGFHIERAREVDASVWKGGVSVEIPIFSSELSRVPLLQFQRERAELEARRQELQDEEDLVRLHAEMSALRDGLNALESGEIAAGREAMRLAELGLRSGELSLLHYLEARKSGHELSMKRPELVARLRAANSALEALIGGWHHEE